jgi:hypothetical protein
MKIRFLLGVIGLICVTVNFAWAEDTYKTPTPPPAEQSPFYSSNPDATPQAESNTVAAKKDTKVFVGLDMGSSNLYKVPSNEQTKHGYLFDVKALASLYYSKWDIDLGLGYFSDNMSTNVNNLRIVTNGILIDAEPQYRITPQFQFGPVVNVLAGSDVSFSESEPGANSDTFNLLAGVGAKYELPVSSYSVRLVGQIMDTVGASRSVWVLTGGVQFGFSVANP